MGGKENQYSQSQNHAQDTQNREEQDSLKAPSRLPARPKSASLSEFSKPEKSENWRITVPSADPKVRPKSASVHRSSQSSFEQGQMTMASQKKEELDLWKAAIS